MNPCYHASPESKCICPAKSFDTQAEAVQYAREAAATFHVGYRVWQLFRGRIRCVATVKGEPVDVQRA